jgi:hypothetical protein
MRHCLMYSASDRDSTSIGVYEFKTLQRGARNEDAASDTSLNGLLYVLILREHSNLNYTGKKSMKRDSPQRRPCVEHMPISIWFSRGVVQWFSSDGKTGTHRSNRTCMYAVDK